MKSAVDFPTPTRVHIGLGVSDIAASMAFYGTLLDMAPTKTRPGYAKFEAHNPAVNLSLNQLNGGVSAQNTGTHFGIQVKSTEEVAAAGQRLAAAGLKVRSEENVTCCYAVQDKVWVEDPDGNSWEVFVVTQANTKEYIGKREAGSACCASNTAEACC